MLSLDPLNAATQDEFVALLDGTYEHSPWVAKSAWVQRPFATLAALKLALARAVRGAGHVAQLALIRVHPELAGKAMLSRTLTSQSNDEQGRAGLSACSEAEFALLHSLNARYKDKFGWPFILAVKHLDRPTIIRTFAERLNLPAADEFENCMANIEKITRWRLDDLTGYAA